MTRLLVHVEGQTEESFVMKSSSPIYVLRDLQMSIHAF